MSHNMPDSRAVVKEQILSFMKKHFRTCSGVAIFPFKMRKMNSDTRVESARGRMNPSSNEAMDTKKKR